MKIVHMLILLLFMSVVEGAAAWIWQDKFSTEVSTPAEQAGNWRLVGNESSWNVDGEFLRTEIRPRKPFGVIFQRLQFIASPGPYSNFTITLENIGVASAKFGIALGKNFKDETPPGEIEDIGYYLFFTNDMRVARNLGGHVGEGQRWNTHELERMELRFKTGRFQLFAEGEARLDFKDANFRTIDSISFILAGFVPNNGKVGKAWVDSFTFATPSLSVSSRDKLTTRWARIKQNR